LSTRTGITVSGRLNCSSKYAACPICCTFAKVAGVGPNEVCSKKRAFANETAGGGGEVNVTTAPPYDVPFATAVARTNTVDPTGIAAGAVNTPPDVIVPTAGDPPVVPFTDHVTAVFALPVTVAEKLCDAPNSSVVVPGLTVTTTGTVNVTVALATVEGLAAAAAVTATVEPAGITAGAV